MSTNPKKLALERWKLYVITDACAPTIESLLNTARLAIRGGASVIQLRDKKSSDPELVKAAKQLLVVTRESGVPLIINDRIEVARLSGAQGVHLGQEDGPLAKAREILGVDAIIGRSTHNPEQALAAVKEGADYIGVGPVFQTPTKPAYLPVGLEFIKFAAKSITIPFVAIGGIDSSNIKQVLDAGARRVAVVRAVMASADPHEAAQRLTQEIERYYEKV